MAVVTRFAPSPTGRLHRGHALSALIGWSLARAAGGQFRLRVEDIDSGRCRPEYTAGILEDLNWLGLDWDGPELLQASRRAAHDEALARLQALGVVYRCACTRADIAAAASAPHGRDGPIYPGTCRGRDDVMGGAWRLDVAAAHALTGRLTWQDAMTGPQPADALPGGDIVIARRDIGPAYHLAVVVDDDFQGVTDVVRGADLAAATPVQRLLQALLGLPAQRYHHHPLLLGPDGKRLAKRDQAETLASLRVAGVAPSALLAELRQHATPWPIGAPHVAGQ
ncbi:MAG: tRNA glutamyl-Q(34) synthetase GluQRS [Alphaproteobacteria bacterium PA4]|nr:MAG: tRNA glutamyl-Q(34) synthetase GluQRS [Alphaproteobacteria bacterium PA4]